MSTRDDSGPQHMFLDTPTLQDLEILPLPTVKGTTLWSLLNRTRSRIGSAELREQLLNPPHDVDTILARQRAHQALAADAGPYREVLDRTAGDDVERYLSVTWQLPEDMPLTIRFRKWYRQYLQDVARGRLCVASLLEAAADLRARLARTDAVLLRSLGDEIDALLNRSAMQELRRAVSPATPASNLRFDQLARDGARESLNALLRRVGSVEAFWSIAVATAEHGWTYPRASSRLRIVGLVHPFLGPRAVPNDLDLDDRVRVCFLTGPNMAGKSTFLKATALAVLLAHIGAGVPARSMEFVPVGTLFSSVQIVDNLDANESFYLAEVRRIGALAAALDEHGSALAVVDEPFRGTNVHDAAEATLAIITRLAAHPAALVFVASHVGEVAPAIRTDPRIAFFSFTADVTSERPTFDYLLRDGVSEQRLGMTLLRQEGVLERLERSARSATVHVPAPSENVPHQGRVHIES